MTVLRARATETAAVLLIIVGIAAWIATPVFLLLGGADRPATAATDAWRLVVLIAGCGLGGLVAASALPALARSVVVGAAAVATVLAAVGPGLLAGPGWQVAAADGVGLVAAAGAALVGAVAGARVPARKCRLVAIAAIELATLGATLAVVGTISDHLPRGAVEAMLVATLGGLYLGGVAARHLVPGTTGARAAQAWLVIGVTTIVVPLSSATTYLATPVLAVLALVAVPFAAGLSAVGASSERPVPAELPAARADVRSRPG